MLFLSLYAMTELRDMLMRFEIATPSLMLGRKKGKSEFTKIPQPKPLSVWIKLPVKQVNKKGIHIMPFHAFPEHIEIIYRLTYHISRGNTI